MSRVFLILSPHIDDAALSCSNFIYKNQTNKIRIVVANFFTQGESHDDPLYKLRLKEESEVAQVLSVESICLGFIDAPFRTKLYSDFLGIICKKDSEYDELQILVAKEISRLINELNPTKVLSPLAIGNHIDHRIIRDASIDCVPSESLLFYEDRPYAFMAKQRKLVVEDMDSNNPEQWNPEQWKDYLDQQYVKSFLREEQKLAVMECLIKKENQSKDMKFTKEISYPPEISLAEKLVDTLKLYRSQFDSLFPSTEIAIKQYASLDESYYSIDTPNFYPIPSHKLSKRKLA